MDEKLTLKQAPPSLIFTLNDHMGNDPGEAVAMMTARGGAQHIPIPDTLTLGGFTYNLAKVHYWTPAPAHYMSYEQTQTGWVHTNDLGTRIAEGVSPVQIWKAQKSIKELDVI